MTRRPDAVCNPCRLLFHRILCHSVAVAANVSTAALWHCSTSETGGEDIHSAITDASPGALASAQERNNSEQPVGKAFIPIDPRRDLVLAGDGPTR